MVHLLHIVIDFCSCTCKIYLFWKVEDTMQMVIQKTIQESCLEVLPGIH